MTLDIRGSLKNTRMNRSPYVVFEEMLSNGIDSFLIRKNWEPLCAPLSVSFDVEFFNKELIGDAYDMKVTCADNGAGLGDAETKAFVTKDTSFKDDLEIDGIGECKGSGRIQYFHYFSKVSLRSIFRADDGTYLRRSLAVDETTKEIDENSFRTEPASDRTVGTSVTLDGIKADVYAKLFADLNLRQEFSAQEIKRHLVLAFLHRLVTLKDHLGDFAIKITTNYNGKRDEQKLLRSDLPEVTNAREVDVHYVGTAEPKKETFFLSHYKLKKTEYDLPRNVVALCAKSSPVQPITRRYLKTGALENNPVDGYYHLVLVESAYLDRYVNEQRDGFRLPTRPDSDSLFLGDMLSFEEIFDTIDPEIRSFLAPPDWDRDELVETIEEKYGISSSMIANVDVRVRQGDTEESVAKRVLRALGDKAVQETSELFDLKEEIAKTSPDSDDFRTKVNELAWKFTASLKTINMANLSQLVVRRAAIIEILGMAIRSQLQVQKGEGRKKDEKLIHSIFFPMGKDSKETSDHDIWLLSEEYHYYDYIASDKTLSKIEWDDGELLFEPDIDAALQEIFEKRSDDNKGKRPDIALFCKEGSAIIIEFKAPNVNLDDHVNDLMEYSQLLAAKSKGRLRKFYGYLIGSQLNPLRLRGYKRFPNGSGYFSTDPIVEPSNQQALGELYSEILFYEDIERKAKMRLQVYKERLDFKFD